MNKELGLVHQVCKFIEEGGELCKAFKSAPKEFENKYCFGNPESCYLYMEKLRYDKMKDEDYRGNWG